MYSKDIEIPLDLNKKDIATNVLITTGGTKDHNKLENRDIKNQHPISAITDLSETLETKQNKGDYALKSEIPTNNNQLANGAEYITADYHDDTKQDVINDLNAIRQGAELGATALQSVPNEYVTETELNAKGYLTSYTETDPVYIADKPNIALKSEIPTKVSSFINDANYQTESDVTSMIASIPQFTVSIVQSLPSVGEKMVLYLVPKTSASGDNIYDEYIWLESTSSFELIGSTTVDLSDYYTKTETDELLENKQDVSSAIQDVKLNNLSVVENNIANIPIAGQNTLGVINGGDQWNSVAYINKHTGYGQGSVNAIFIRSASNARIDNRDGTNYANGAGVIKPDNIDYAVKRAMCDGKGADWTDEEKASARNRMGLLEKTSETWTFTLEDGTEVTKTMILGA